MYHYLMKWVAQIIQQPDTKLEVAVVIIGETRTGKTTFTNIISSLFGRYAVPNITDINHVVGKFNDVFENKRFVVVNECQRISELRRMNFDRLKTLITDKTASYNKKYGTMRQGDNAAHFVFCSNNPIPLRIAPDDARFCVIRVSSDRKEDVPYFRWLAEHCTKDFYEHLMYLFMNLDISDFEHRDIPLTEAKAIIQEASRDSLDSFVITHFQDLHNITGSDTFDLFKRFCKESNISLTGISRPMFLAEMRHYTGESTQKWIKGHNLKVYNLLPEVIQEIQQFNASIDGD